jgi:hypothetical protein
VVAGLLVFAGVTALIGSGGAGSKLGDDVFEVGRADRLRPEVERDGPLLFQALVGDRDLYVQYVGEGRWTAFEAVAPGAPRRCQLQWRTRPRRFVDRCTGTAYPADGTGLVRYRTTVDEDGVVVVDLRRRESGSSPSSSPT